MSENPKSNSSGEHKLRPYKLYELAQMYKVDRRTFQRWLYPFRELIGARVGDYYTSHQVELIFANIGPPE